MKVKLITIAIILTVVSILFAQDFRNRAPTPQEQRYLSGVTSHVQDQLDALGASANGTFTGPTLVGATNSGTFYGLRVPVTTKTNSYTSTIADQVVLLNASSVTNTIPSATNNVGKLFSAVSLAAKTNNIIKPTGSETIGGQATWAITNAVTVVSDGTNYQVLSSY